jgi:serine/threonine-protein kinase RsbW
MATETLLEYPSVSESEDRFLDDVQSFLDDNGIPEDICRQLLLSVSEAFTNALVHGNQLDSTKAILVRLAVNDSAICADILDQGQGGIERINRRKPSGPLSEGGRGIDLIGHYATTVQFEETESGGLKVSMSFGLARTNKLHGV